MSHYYGDNIMLRYWTVEEENGISCFGRCQQEPINGEASHENRQRNEAMRQDARIKFLILRYLKECKDSNTIAVDSDIKKMLENSEGKYDFNVVKFAADHLMAVVEFHREEKCEWTFRLKETVHYSTVY
ncbi:hypothetical protein CAEBREN_06663 [Caenorhabditis brenneri]|uniref:Uncharacterized protein n=1 Tax=Caenorhabditis brenneri TaxID=135651 RepID=G0MAF6_CAEBE|nr:hypothetical protein CAEBREN_06663 [Caenorhabditis brenneri]